MNFYNRFLILSLLFTITFSCAKKITPPEETNAAISASPIEIENMENTSKNSKSAENINTRKKGKIACIEKSLINPKIECDNTFDEVCGCDGITYKNKCEAKKKGLVSYKMGPCIKTSDY
ncbi:MAG: hypothetical protein RLZZ546_2621 [Bacteroidota bacterium]